MALHVNKNRVEPQQAQQTSTVLTAPIEAPVHHEAQEEPVENLGSKSNTVEVIAPLGDPSQRHTLYGKDKDGNKYSRVVPKTVGYRFRALVDMDVPDIGLGADAKKNEMSYEAKNIRGISDYKTKHVHAGEYFDLTRFETGLMFSTPEFNCSITGNGKEYIIVYTKQPKKTMTSGGTLRGKTVSIRGVHKSIKDIRMIPVLSFKEVKDPKANGTSRVVKYRTINPGFEKWEPLCESYRPKTTKLSKEEARNESAAEFLASVRQTLG